MLLLLLHIHVHILTGHGSYSQETTSYPQTSFPPTLVPTSDEMSTTSPKFITRGTPGSSATMPLSTVSEKEEKIKLEDEGPIFSQVTLVLLLGDSGVIDCNGYQDDILWYKDDKFVQNFTSDIVAINGEDVANAGQYTCRVGNNTFITHVFIVGADALTSPISDNSTISITQITGGSLYFNTSINVYPIRKLNISVTFARVVDDISEDTAPAVDITSKTELSGNVLSYSVDQVDWNEDNGYYTVVVQYGTQRHFLTFRVTIMEEAKIQKFRKLPNFVEAGKVASIKARVTGHPTPLLKWYHQRCCIEDDIVSVNDVISSESSDLYSIANEGQTLTLSSPSESDQQLLNGTYWFEVEHPLTSNLSSVTTDYIIQGWGMNVSTPNTTIYENMGEFSVSCRTEDIGELEGKYTLKIKLNGDVLNSIPNLNFNDDDETVVYNVSSVTASFEGTYQCVAESDNVTLWSTELAVVYVPQPHFLVSPGEYSVVSGNTAIFSCEVKGVDPEEEIRFMAGSSPSALADREASSDEPDILYLGSVTEQEFVRCDTPHNHPNPVYNTVTTKIVQNPLVTIDTSITKSPFHKTGDTVVIKCDIVSSLLSSSPSPDVYWKHKGKKYSYNGSKGNVHMYDNGVIGNSTTHILAIQDVEHGLHNGTYTCVFVSEEAGRYEDTIDIIIKQGLTKNVIAVILGSSLLFLVVVLILVVVLLVRLKYRRSSPYDDTADCTVATNTLVKNEIVQESSSPEVTAM